MATATLTLPNTFPTNVGIVAKHLPFAALFTTTKTINGPKLRLTGQTTSMLRELRRRLAKRVFIGPI